MARVTSGCVCVCAMQVQLCPRRAGAGPAVVRLPNVGVRPSLTSVRSVRLCLSLRFHCVFTAFSLLFTAYHCLSLPVTAFHGLSRPFKLPFLAFSLLITASHCFSLPFKLPFLVISLLITAYHCFSLPFTAFQAAFPCVFTAYHCLSLRFHCFSLPFKLPFHWVSTRAARTPASDELHRP